MINLSGLIRFFVAASTMQAGMGARSGAGKARFIAIVGRRGGWGGGENEGNRKNERE